MKRRTFLHRTIIATGASFLNIDLLDIDHSGEFNPSIDEKPKPKLIKQTPEIKVTRPGFSKKFSCREFIDYLKANCSYDDGTVLCSGWEIQILNTGYRVRLLDCLTEKEKESNFFVFTGCHLTLEKSEEKPFRLWGRNIDC